MAELIQVPFSMWTRVGLRNCVLGWGPDPPMGRCSLYMSTQFWLQMISTLQGKIFTYAAVIMSLLVISKSMALYQLMFRGHFLKHCFVCLGISPYMA